jgi:membrane protein required for colicin V production
MLTVIDYIIIGVLALSAIISVLRGFVREIMAIATWVAALWVAWHFCRELAALLDSYIKSETLRYSSAFIGLFIVTMILGGMVNFLLSQLINKTGLSSTDRVLGLGFGLLRGILVVSILIMIIYLTPLADQPVWRDSRLIPAFMPAVQWLQHFIPKDIQPTFVISNAP